LRGASALEKLLPEFAHDPIAVLVVWAPVLRTDIAPPTPEVQARLSDATVAQFWDPNRFLAGQVTAAATAGVPIFAPFKPKGRTPYDLVGVYPAGARWLGSIPAPFYLGNPVVDSIHETRLALRKLLRRR